MLRLSERPFRTTHDARLSPQARGHARFTRSETEDAKDANRRRESPLPSDGVHGEYGATVVVCSHHRVARSIDRLGSARLGSTHGAPLCGPDKTRREMRRGRLPSTDYTVRLILLSAARALRLVRSRLRPTGYIYQHHSTPYQFNHSMGLGLPLFFLFFFFCFFTFFPLFEPPARDLSYFFGNAPP